MWRNSGDVVDIPTNCEVFLRSATMGAELEIFYVLAIPTGSGLVLILVLGILLALPDRKI